MSNNFNANEYRAHKQSKIVQKSKFFDGMLVVCAGALGLIALSVFGYNELAGSKGALITTANVTNVKPEKKLMSGDEAFDDFQKMLNANPRLRKKHAKIIEGSKKYGDVPSYKKMPIQDYVKAKGLQDIEMQKAKYNRTIKVLRQCVEKYDSRHKVGIYYVMDHYRNKNKSRYKNLGDVKTSKPNPANDLSTSFAQVNEQAQNIKTPMDALRWKMSGDLDRSINQHASASMGMMGAMDGMLGDLGRYANSKAECFTVKQLAQTGQLDIRM